MPLERRILAALFLALSACVGLGTGMLLIAEGVWPEALEVDPDTLYMSYTCGPLFLVTGIMSLLGTLACLMGERWHLAMIGAVASLISGYVVLGIASIVLVVSSRDEFIR
jgi:hypothetical protein